MSWQLAAYGLLALALAAGFAWYERSKPDAKIVALVGALAALGALGRIAFAAVPNIKPTTDIVLIAGYALGGAPGFTVGAVDALVSNFFFGQGPWTPWQMLGWGAVGVAGALLPRWSARRIPLALICAVAGFAFTAFQDFGDWVNYSDHSRAQLGAYLASGIGFDLISAAGCAAFALLFGPALARALARFRLRLNVQWVTPTVLALAAVFALGARPAGAAQTPEQYLAAAPLNTPLYSGWAALGLEAAGVRPPAKLIAYIDRTQAADPGSLERSILVLAPLGRRYAGPVAKLVGRLHFKADGSIAQQTNLTAFAILALKAADRPVPATTLRWLKAQEDSDGGFNYSTKGAASDVDDTGAVLEALPHTPRAVTFLLHNENRDGGFPSQPGQSSNAQSTAFAIEGLVAAGRHPTRAIAYLKSLIQPNGAIDYAQHQSQTPEWVTGEALLGLAAKPLPLAPLPAAVEQHTRTATTPAPTPEKHRRAAPVPPARQPVARPETAVKRGYGAIAQMIGALFHF